MHIYIHKVTLSTFLLRLFCQTSPSSLPEGDSSPELNQGVQEDLHLAVDVLDEVLDLRL